MDRVFCGRKNGITFSCNTRIVSNYIHLLQIMNSDRDTDILYLAQLYIRCVSLELMLLEVAYVL